MPFTVQSVPFRATASHVPNIVNTVFVAIHFSSYQVTIPNIIQTLSLSLVSSPAPFRSPQTTHQSP